ncbi:MAG: translation elongation factor 4, partial [Clostridia bacterium]
DAKEQLLDSMDIERERGITIKLTPVKMNYNFEGVDYELNLIDTPGHVDFTYEVSRSLKACEGAILIVDASQGIEAQTLTNCYLALDNNLEIIPVINKIDLPSARPEEVRKEIEDVIGLDASDAPLVSAKECIGIEKVLEQIIKILPPPTGDINKPLKALIFDSIYDSYKGAISIIRVFDGVVKVGDTIKMMATGKVFDVTEVGVFIPRSCPQESLSAGDVGYLCASIKNVADTKVGDTITLVDNPTPKALAGYKEVSPMVFSGIYPADGADYDDLKDALEKLKLNDASLAYEPEVSAALGFGFRCGFLGLLHMEIVEERLEREFDIDLVTTAPSVSYQVVKNNGDIVVVSNPSNLPSPAETDHLEEPMVRATLYTPPEYVGPIMELCQDKRGVYVNLTYLDATRVKIDYDIPLNEIIYDFFDSLKSRTKGYASLDYEITGYKQSELVKLDLMLNGEICDALSLIVHKDKAYARGRLIAEK